MATFENVLTAGVPAAAVLLLLFLYRRFRRRAVERSYALLAAAAIVFGLLAAIPGLIHTIAVVGSTVKNDKPYNLRFAWLVTIGLILMQTGTVNVVLSRWVKSYHRWAVAMAAVSTGLLLVFLMALHPADSQGILIGLYGAYLVLLLAHLNRPAPASTQPSAAA